MKFAVGDVVENKKWHHKLMIMGINPKGKQNYYEAMPIFLNGEFFKFPGFFRIDYLEKEYKIDEQYLRKEKLKKIENSIFI